MRSHNDLFGAFDSVDTDSVDPEEMLARVHTGTAALQTARRRRIAVLSVAAAAVLIAVVAVVVPTLGNDRPDRGQVANTPTAEQEPPSTVEALPSLGLSFVVRESPEGLPIRHLSASLGSQMLTFWPSDPTISGELVVRLYDPESSGVEAPELTGESVAVDSVGEGPVTADVIASTPQGELEEFGIGWQTENGHWLTVIGTALSLDLARPQVLALAAVVEFDTAEALTFPFQLGYVPDGLQLIGALSYQDSDGNNEASLDFDDGSDRYRESALQIRVQRAIDYPGEPEGTGNTTVGSYEAYLDELPAPEIYRVLSVFDVEGFHLSIGIFVGDVAQFDEAEMRRIAESIVVIPGAATDTTVWTAEPFG